MTTDEHTPLQDNNSANDVVGKDGSDRVDISDAIEGAGCGYGTFLYQIGTILFCCLEGAEILILTVVGPVLRCEWNLSPLQLSMLQSSTMVAMMVAAAISSPLGDSIGRKPLALTAAIGTTIVGVLSAFVRTYWQFITMRIIIGAFIGIGAVPALVWSGETMPKILRATAFCQVSLAWGVGSSIGAGIAYFVLDPYGWRGLLLTVPLVFSPSVIVMAVISESPRYDYFQGYYTKAQNTIENLYRLNNKGKIKIKLKKLETVSPNETVSESRLTAGRVLDELRATDNILNTLLLLMLTFSTCFTYYLYAYSTPRILNEGYCTGEVVARNQSCVFRKHVLFDLGVVKLSEPLGVLITLFLLETRCGRRKTFIGISVLILLLTIPLYFCVSESFLFWFVVVVGMVVASIALSYTILACEYMPTPIRAFMLASVSVISRLSGSLAIFCTEYIVNEGPRAAFVVIQGVTIVSFVTLLALKRETRDQNLL